MKKLPVFGTLFDSISLAVFPLQLLGASPLARGLLFVRG